MNPPISPLSARTKYIVVLFTLVYLTSLSLPGVVYVAKSQNNQKYGLCSALHSGERCERSGTGWNCASSISQATIRNPMTAEDTANYCGNDWNTPVSEVDYGYRILLWGWLGLISGIVAWYANPLMILALIFMVLGKYKHTMMISIVAFVIGLTTFFIDSVTVDMSGNSVRTIDHLAVGYFVWMFSILILIVPAYRENKKLKVS